MALYTEEDVSSDFYGDIVLDTKGDLKIANSFETIKSCANFLLRTDLGEYAPDNNVGCNLGKYVGRLNNEDTQKEMEDEISFRLATTLLTTNDVSSFVSSFDENEVIAVVTIGGYYLVDNEIINISSENITYTFPYIDGTNLVPFVLE